MKHQPQKQRHPLPGKAFWRACRRISYQDTASRSDLHGPRLLVMHQQETPAEQEGHAQSRTLQQWLRAGGKADAAVLYNVEIFVKMV